MRKRFAVAIVSAVVLLSAAVALAQAPAPFSADMQMHSKSGQDMTGKFFFDHQKTRMDMNSPRGEMSTIADIQAKKSYTLMHDQKMYMEHDLNQPRPMGRGPRMPEFKPYDPSNPCANEPDTTCKKVGTAVVNGRDTDKWEFTKDGKLQSTVYIDQKLHFPIKNEMADGTVFELSNIKEGPQPASEFEVPAGYQKFDMGNMMRGMGRPD